MFSQLDIRQRFEGRMWLFQVSAFVLLLMLLLRMVDLQFLQHEGLMLQAESNRLNIVPILPTRGTITDRFGIGLAVNDISYRLTMIPERVENMDLMMTKLASMMQWTPRQIKRIKKRIKRSRKDRPVLLNDKLTWAQVAPLSARLHRFPGLDVQAGTHRSYPYKELTSHLIGYLALARSKDLEQGYLHNEYVGRSGLERSFEKRLHGTLGSQLEEVDAHGRRIAVLQQTPSSMGKDIRLSLNVRLQKAAAEVMGKRTGAVVVMDVHSGEVLTLLSTPGVDTNQFTLGLEKKQWRAWLNDEQRPLLNRTTQAAYPPASTWKLISSFAGLRQNVPLANGHTQCKGFIQLADRKMRCWKRRGHGRVNLHDAIVHSCDVYFYKLGDQLGMKHLSDEGRLWGFGEITGVPLPPESRGHLAPSMQRLQNGRERHWYRGETMITAIGQGQTTVTPLQMARFAAAIANGGDILRPHLEAGKPPEIIRHVDVKPEHLKRIQESMYAVANKPGGTAYYRLRHAAWKIAGKTGTAQVISMSQDDKAKRTPEINKYKDHAWFMGYAPYDNPKIAFAILVEHGGHGGSAAGPIAKAIVAVLAAQEKNQ
ncbi:MAG: penicillin-binding protein 2 [Mariprofundaceae bacterium]|nr:penicillin-binding protein 2 [Mariprofundaceae bacterium]